jgi:hypothetical protein
MAVNADSVLVEVETRLNTASNKAAEAQFDASMNRIKSSAGDAERAVSTSFSRMERELARLSGPAAEVALRQRRLGEAVRGTVGPLDASGKAMANTSQRSRLLGFQIADLGTQFASGTNMGVAFAQQMPQIANALDGTRGAVGRLATFLSGPFGAAILAAGSVLLLLSMRHSEAGDKADKQTDSSKTLRDAIIDLDKATRDAIRTQEQSNRQKEISAKASLDEALALRAKTEQTLKAALAEEQLFIAQQGRVTSAAGAEVGAAQVTNQAIQRAEARIKELNTRLAENDQSIQQAQRALAQSQVPNLLRRAEAATDPVTKATVEYEDALAKLQDRWTNGVMGTGSKARAEFDRQAQSLLRVRDAAIKAAQATSRGGEQREIGGDFTLSDALAAVRSVGGTPTSTTRTPERNAKVGGVANSFHLSGQAIDVAKGPGVTLNKLVAAIRNKGGRILEALDEGDHFHIAFKTGSAAAEQLARATERAADKTTRQNNAFNAEMEQLQAKILAAQRPIAKSQEEELKAFEDTLAVERDRQNNAYLAAAAEKRITDAQAQLLIAKNNELATAQLMARYQAEGLQKRQVVAALEQDRQAIVIDGLKDEADVAVTAKERRDSALRILDAEIELQRLKLQQIVDNTKIGSVEHERAVLALQNLDAERRRGQASIERDPQNQSPSQRYLADLDAEAKSLNETLEQMAVDKMKELGAFAGDSTAKVLGLKGALGDVVSQLIDLAFQLVIIRPLMQALGGGGGGGGLFSLLGLGGPKSSAGAINVSGATSDFLGNFFRAKGGPVRQGGTYIVGEQGPELFSPSSNGQIIPNNALPNLGGGGNVPAIVRVMLNAGEYFDARVERVSGPVAIGVVRAAAPSIVQTATSATVSKISRKKM